MRILAIRGENLASLAGRFEVDLEQPPFSGAGLFAITGQTGAGKSTLLDAICVALFDTTPRLEKSGGVIVGRADDDPKARLRSNDVRALLRRGTGSGFAEVDYIGRDGGRYRARWSLHRARDKASGAYQKQEMSIIELATGRSLGRTKIEVLAEISRTIGLSYDQFRRSALLAQGDFAAFLRASSDERASLLEQMTGTELYSALSIKAYVSYKEAEDRYADVVRECGAVQVLPPSGRAALEVEIEALNVARKAAVEARMGVEGAVRWFDALAQLREREEQAIQKTLAAELAHAAEAPLREQLADFEAAVEQRPALVAAEDAETAHVRAVTLLAARTEEAATATRLHDEIKAALEIEAAARAQALAVREAAQPVLDEAIRLDLLIHDGRVRRSGLITAENQAASELEKAQQDLKALDEQRRGAEIRVGALAVWLADHAALATLVDAWSLCQPALKRYAEASAAGKKAATARPLLVLTETRAVGAHALAAHQVTTAKEALGTAEEAWRAADDEAQGAAVTEETRIEGEQLVQRLRRAVKLAPIVEQVDEKRELVERESRNAAEARTRAAAASDEAKRCHDEATLKNEALKEAERALQQARATVDLVEHRAELRDDEPCPLCGAKDHPYAREASPLGVLVTAADARVTELRTRRDELLERKATCRTNAVAAEKSAGEAEQRAAEAQEEIARLGTRWRKETAAFGVDVRLPDAEGHAVVKAAILAAEAQRDAILTAETKAAALATSARSQQTARDARRKALDEAALALTTATTGLVDAAEKLKQCDEQTAQAERDRARALEDIAPALDAREGWRAKLDADPSAFASTCAAEVIAYRNEVAKQAGCEKAVTDFRAQQAVAVSMVVERTSAADNRAKDRADADAVLDRLGGERAALLEGRPTEEVRAALDAAVKQADDRHNVARSAERDRAQNTTEARTEARTAAEALKERAEATERARESLTEALRQSGIDLPTLRVRLARDQPWIDATRATLTGLDTVLADRRAVCGERTSARAEHKGKDHPSLTEEEAHARLAPAAEEEEKAIAALAEARERRKADDGAQEKVQGKAAVLEACRKSAEHWGIINDLIGSADGKKFRVFAQSLTLEALVSHANEHLNDFAPRYRLMRVPEQDLDLQIVDQDMGHEVRSVNSLSGGESFLVSLALALGLSSLAARDVRVETLFIDEGFGTLDPETLVIALAALDALQSSGRQIALISHVSDLADQIGAQVRLQKLGGGRSQIAIEGATASAGAGFALEKPRSTARPRKKKAPSTSEPTAT